MNAPAQLQLFSQPQLLGERLAQFTREQGMRAPRAEEIERLNRLSEAEARAFLKAYKSLYGVADLLGVLLQEEPKTQVIGGIL